MSDKQFLSPSWITNVTLFQNAILHTTTVNPESITYIVPSHKDSFIAGFKQFLFWHRHFQPSITQRTLMFALLGAQGLQTLDIPELIEDMAKVGPIHHAIEFYQGPNTKFLAISFSSQSDVTHFQQHFNFYNGSAVVYVQHSMSRTHTFSILWLPPLFQDQLIDDLISKFALRYSFFKGSIRLKHGKYVQSSLVKGTCTLKPGITPQDIPHLFRLPYPHNGSALLIMDSRQSLCLKCMKQGHLRKECPFTKCNTCHSFHPIADQCPPKSYSAITANKSANDPTDGWPEDLEYTHILDDHLPQPSSSPKVNTDVKSPLPSSHISAPLYGSPASPSPPKSSQPLLDSPPPQTDSDPFRPAYLDCSIPSSSSALSEDSPSIPITSEFTEPPPTITSSHPQSTDFPLIDLSPHLSLVNSPSHIPVKIPSTKESLPPAKPTLASKSPRGSKKKKSSFELPSKPPLPSPDNNPCSSDLFSPSSPSLSTEPLPDLIDLSFKVHDPLFPPKITRSSSYLTQKWKKSSSSFLNLSSRDHDHPSLTNKKQNLTSSSTSFEHLASL